MLESEPLQTPMNPGMIVHKDEEGITFDETHF